MMGQGDAGQPMVHWERLGQPLFDRLINALVDRRHDDKGDDVQVIDGRGGDGGLDILVVTAEGREIVYQLKYFPNGFDGRFKDSRKQITSSLNRALQTRSDLDEWILVAPCTATRSGWSFIDKLKAEHPEITITFIDRSRLDSKWVAKHPDVVRAVISRDEILEKAEILNTEKSALARGLPDLFERHRNLDQVSREADPNWFWRVYGSGPHQVAELHPHHARAAERSPVSISFSATGASDDPDLKRFTDAMRFGAIDAVRLPGRLVSDLVINGPEIVRSAQPAGEIVELRFVPDLPVDQTHPCVLEIDDVDSSTTTHQGLITRAAQGPAGATMRQTFHGGAITLTWRFPDEQPGPAYVDMAIDLGRARTAHELWRITRLLLSWSNFKQVRMLLDGKTFAVLGARGGALDSKLLDDAIVLHEFTDDLLLIEREFGREFLVPDVLSPLDRIDTRIFRRMLEGRVVCLPHASSINVTLIPAALEDDGLTEDRALVALFPTEDPRNGHADEPGAASYWTLDSLKSQGSAAEFVLKEQMGCYFPRMFLEDATTVQKRLARGEEVPARLRPRGNQRPRIYLPARLRPDQQIAPEPWGLHGIKEAPEFIDDHRRS